MIKPTAAAAKLNSEVGRTARKEVRRQQLIDATITSISKYGITGTTTPKVTSLAGLSAGTVNFHFQTKQSLLEETLRHLGQEHHAQWQKSVNNADLDPAAKLLAIVDAHFHPTICNRKKLTVWFAFYGEAANREAYRAIMSEMDGQRIEISIGLCRRIVEEGGYERIAPEEISATLEALYDGFCLNILIYPKIFTRQDAMRRVRAYLAATFPQHAATFDPQLLED
ncbi:TetR/AcrR family transcriptional regulator [Roseovarius sp. D0-M9]|uniref:TetR/AcrR family transcriptional regulator n=1 Tax=Roseovarius sp. D0-M9 TaxID=3127117 RepID=UPI00300FF745